tara:strand:- start:608 stop:1492 length:885 start_codon:yes stop_codon:yes gene_type:complete
MTTEIIKHDEIVDLLKLTMLIYNYGKDFTVKSGQDIQEFIKSLSKEENKNLLENVNDLRKEVLYSIAENSPHGEILGFVNTAETDLQCAVTISHAKKRINIIFRGSESKSDWYYDLKIFKHKLEEKYQSDNDDVYVHLGFYEQLKNNNSYENILKLVKEGLVSHPEYELYITGHSLGGALCTLFGYLLSCELLNKVTVVSFASPRVGNEEWKKVFDSKKNLIHYRVTNNRDVVTAAPMWGYKHTGHNIRLFEDSYIYYPDYSYNGWWEFSLFNCWSVGDHDCDLYYTRLIKNNW